MNHLPIFFFVALNEEQDENPAESADQRAGTKIPYQCCVCRKAFPDLSSTIRHIKYHAQRQAAVAEPALHCGKCGKTFTTKQQLSKHSTVHTDVRPFKCDECDKWFKTLDNVKRHMYVHIEERPFPCPTCGKEFKAKHMLKKHEETHDSERFFECPQCHKKYKAKNSLRDHLLVHSGQRPYKCQHCEQAFYRRSHLATHRVVHSKVKPFACADCDKSFGRREHLKVHERIHSGEKPFKCHLCDRSFNQQSGLRAHVVSHSEDRPYSCSRCTKTFKYPSQVKHHSCKPDVAVSMVCVRGNRGEILTSGVPVDSDLSETMPSLANGECTVGEDEANDVLNSPHCFNAANTIILIQIQDPSDEASMQGESLTAIQVSGGSGDCGGERSTGPGDNVLQDGCDVIGRGQSPEERTTADVSADGGPQGIIVGIENMRGILE